MNPSPLVRSYKILLDQKVRAPDWTELLALRTLDNVPDDSPDGL